MAKQNILMFVDDLYEDLELWYPRIRLDEAGFAVTVAGPEKGKTYHGKHGYPCEADIALKDAKADDCAGLVIAGGYAPDRLRRHREALELTRRIFESGKLVAMICHAGWVPISAGILKGKRATAFHAIADDMINAGVEFVDEAAVVDGNLISSRMPADLPDFMKAILQFLEGGK